MARGVAMIVTTLDGLVAGMIEFPAGDGIAIPAYRARPAKKDGPLPMIVVIQEIFGVHEHIRDICRRLAHAGYYAIAPELYVRQGDAHKFTLEQIPQLFADIVSNVPQAQVMADLDACVAYALGTGDTDTARLGITGFCWGGTIVWLYSAHSSAVKAGVAWYGKLNADKTALQPHRPVDVAANLKAPVLGLYGGQDTSIPMADVELMRVSINAAIKAAGKSSAIHVYADSPHAFLADYRPGYREADAKDGWNKMLAWFKRQGV